MPTRYVNRLAIYQYTLRQSPDRTEDSDQLLLATSTIEILQALYESKRHNPKQAFSVVSQSASLFANSQMFKSSVEKKIGLSQLI